MSVKVETLEKNMAKLTIEVPAADVEKAMQGVYLRTKNRFNIPGFRKGKAPRKMIEQMYGKGIFLEDAVNDLLPESYENAAKESGLEIVSQPELGFDQVEPDKDLIYTATVAVKPEVTLGQYKGIEVPKNTVIVTEDDIMDEIRKEQEKNGVMTTVEDRAVQDKDETTIDFEGFVDGVAFEGGKGTDYKLVIGSGAFIPGFEEQLIGAEIGKETEVNVTFPEDYQAEELKGKAAVFKVTVKGIKVKELPEIDDEFASEVSEFDTLEAYKADVEKNIRERKEKEAKTEKENAVVDKAIENASMEIPDAMVDSQAKTMVNDFAQRMQQQGLTMEMYMQYTGQTESSMLEQMKPQALKRIQTRLVLEAVAAAENIEAAEEDLEKEIENMAAMYQMEADKLKDLMGEEEKNSMKKDIAVQKAVDFLVAQAAEV